jgi:hypothetical protein
VVVAIACFPPAPALAAGGSNDGFFGVNPGDLFKLPQPQWDRHLSAIAANGVQVVRVGAWWSDLEPAAPAGGQHRYAWGDLDQQVAALARHGLQSEPLLSFSAPWGSRVRGDYTAAPDGAGNFASFAAALAQRYGGGGSFWREHPELPSLPVRAYEIWNEENASAYWHPAQSAPEEYADLYAAARTAIHDADAAARVVVGGLAAAGNDSVLAPKDFLRRMYAHRPDLRGAVDAVGFHPYARDPKAVYKLIAGFRRSLDAVAGPGVPVELTEIGWTTADTMEQRRAAYLRELASTLPRSDCGIQRLEAYAWVGPEQATGDREQWFGIANRDGSNKPSATAYAAAVHQMRSAAAPAGNVAICSSSAARSSRSASKSKHARLKLRVTVRRHPTRPGRLLVKARCSTGCRVRVQLRAAQPSGVAFASRSTTFASTSRSNKLAQTLNINFAKRVSLGSSRLKITITAFTGGGQHATRVRTVRLRPAGTFASKAGTASYVAA